MTDETSATDPMMSYTVTVLPAGWRFNAGPQVPLVTAAQHAGIRLPRSCRNGTCRACLCRLLHGQVLYTVDWPGVSADEKAEGWILPCVALARSPLAIEVPDASRPSSTEPGSL